MLRIDSTSTSYNASSVVNDEIVASFSAGVNTPGDNVYISMNVNSLTIFEANLSTIKSDLEDFIDSIVE